MSVETDKIAEIIHYWTSNQQLLIDALVDYFEAEDEICEYCGENQVSCPGYSSEGHRAIWNLFNRINFLRIATGVDR